MRTLIIDNYDSFTFNLYQYIAEVNQEPPIVIKNDELTEAELAGLDYDNLVISPGPGRPDVTTDFGLCAHLIRGHETPILGVCLGHQGIGQVFGGHVVHAPQVMHGRASHIRHKGEGIFRGLPTPFKAIRYHSLVVDLGAAPDLQATAYTDEGVLMALQHRALPIWGVQFHPESICSEHGMGLLRNFRDLSLPFKRTRAPRVVYATPPRARGAMRLHSRKLDRYFDAETTFRALYANSPTAFWLDSSLSNTGMSRFSYMGDTSGPRAGILTYDSKTTVLRHTRHGEEKLHRESVFDYLDRTTRIDLLSDQPIPFDFHGGWVGYFGYELKQECGGKAPYPSPHADAMWMFADRFLAFDHERHETWLVSIAEHDSDSIWFETTEIRLETMHALPPLHALQSSEAAKGRLRQDRGAYVEAIRIALDKIEAGESYEICLTNMISCAVASDGLSLYRILRAINPAPFAAYLRFDGLEILSASPEQFLHVDMQGNVAARPIKGTAPRGATPEQDEANAVKLQHDEKSRAENLMIVDLLRNDLGAVCEIGSVAVPELMAIETYATLHQMVSTVTGRLKADCGAVKCAHRAFPGGSMTGAPKLRTMQILDRLEQAPRGIYSGALGYFGIDGTADLSIVIRAIVLEKGHASIGVGGAILALSDPEAEFDEILLKAKAQLRAIQIADECEVPADISRVPEQIAP